MSNNNEDYDDENDNNIDDRDNGDNGNNSDDRVSNRRKKRDMEREKILLVHGRPKMNGGLKMMKLSKT